MPISFLENDRALSMPIWTSDEGGNRTSHAVLTAEFRYSPIYIKTALRGTAFVDMDGDFGPVGEIVRILPWKNPYDELQYCVKVDGKGLGYAGRDDSTVPEVPMQTGVTPKYWDLLAHFDNLDYEVGDISDDQDEETPEWIYGETPDYDVPGAETTRYCTKDVRAGKEYVTPQGGEFYYQVQGSNVFRKTSFPIPQILPFAEIDVTWFHVPRPAYPRTRIKACIGKVNSNTLVLPSGDGETEYAPETMLFLGCTQQRMRFPDSTRGLNISYAFKRRFGKSGSSDITWNTYPLSDGSFIRFYRGKSTANPIFPLADLNSLFTPHTI